jgi:hypothetical protein
MIADSLFDKRLLSLKSCCYLGYYYRQDLNYLVEKLSNIEGSIVDTNFDRWNMSTKGYSEIYNLWKLAKFNPHSIQWINYYPEQHYSQELVDDIAFYLRLNGVHRSWISRINPGFYAPWHWDVDDNESEYLKKGTIRRYSLHLSTPTPGHAFVLGKDYLYDCPVGSIFKWNDYKEWHAGINAGMTPKFMFHIIGY